MSETLSLAGRLPAAGVVRNRARATFARRLPSRTGPLCLMIVIGLSRFPLFRLCSMLCVALTLTFASASMASIVDRIQHQSSVASDHDHSPFSKIVFETSDHHHEPHTTDSDDGRDAPEHQPGTGHHHHADSGSGFLATPSQGSSWVFSRASSWRPAADNRMAGFLTHGPERPPKSSAIRI